jgi:hypothetical protein
MREIGERLLSLSANRNIQMAGTHHENLDDTLFSWLDGIMDPPRHISDALKHPQLSAHLEKGRIAQETYWEECLKKVNWEIDGPEILNAFSNDKPIEQVRAPYHPSTPMANVLEVPAPIDVSTFTPSPSAG